MVLITVCVSLCSLLLLVWVVLEVACKNQPRVVDHACSACFVALAFTSVVAFRQLVVAPPGGRGPLPFFVFFGAPIGLYLAWVAWRLARAR